MPGKAIGTELSKPRQNLWSGLVEVWDASNEMDFRIQAEYGDSNLGQHIARFIKQAIDEFRKTETKR
jgi:hypothetical protein